MKKTRLAYSLKLKLLSMLGIAWDIPRLSNSPDYYLCRFAPNRFILDNIQCGSIGGFLSALTESNIEKQKEIYGLNNRKAETSSSFTSEKEQNLYWNGRVYNRHGAEYQQLVRRAFQAMFDQCTSFRCALEEFGGRRLGDSSARTNTFDTVLTEQEYCSILTDLRKQL